MAPATWAIRGSNGFDGGSKRHGACRRERSDRLDPTDRNVTANDNADEVLALTGT